MQPVQNPKGPKIDHKFLMMKIMHLSCIIEEVVATMNRRGFQKFKGEKEPVGENMTSENLRRKRNWKYIREEVFQRMCVLSGERNRSRESMVLLMDSDVELLGM
jgi:hypothetical protein